ncbi:YfhO family protein [Lentilactobacillus senioris]|uniref:YfhO family protein n=1 Tax=Lentilactobacillus senioris TaxID=931534 RepID=UPI003D2AB19F
MKNTFKKTPLIIPYTIAFALLAGTMFICLSMADKSFVWFKDGMAQHFPILTQLRSMLEHFISNPSSGFTHWDWSLGLGADQLTNFSYYVIGDLFNYLIILFPKNNIEFAYGVLIMLRLYCVGLAFLLYTTSYKFSKPSKLVGALSYTFAGFVLYSSLHHPFFLLPMIFFPLLAYGIDRIVYNHSFLPFSLAVFLVVLGNFYFAWMLAIATVIYALIRIGSRFNQSQFKFWRSVGRLLAGGILGALMGLIVFLPTVLFALKSTRISGKFASGLLFYTPQYYLGIPNSILNVGSLNFWLIIGVSSISFLGVVYSFKHFREHLWLNIGNLIVLIGILIPAVGAVFNGLSAPSNRWALLGVLGFSFAAMILVDNIHILSGSDIATFLATSILLIFLVWLGHGGILNLQHQEYIAYGLLFLTLIVIMMSIMFGWSKTTSGIVLGVLVTFNLFTNILGTYSLNSGAAVGSQLNKGLAQQYSDNYYNGANKYVAKQTGFFRTALMNHYLPGSVSNFTNTNTNIGMNSGVNDESSYLTLQNGYIGDFSTAIANSQFSFNTPLAENDYRTAANNLLGVRYFYVKANKLDDAVPYGYQPVKDADGKVKKFQAKSTQNYSHYVDNPYNTVLVKSNNALPLIYTQKQTISDNVFNKMDGLDRERAMTQGAQVSEAKNQTTELNYQTPRKNIKYSVEVHTDRVIDSKQQLTASRLGLLGKDDQAINKALNGNHAQLNLDSNASATDKLISQNKILLQQNKRQNANSLKEMVSDANGHQLKYTLNVNNPNQTKNAELYLVLDGISIDDNTVQDKNNIDANDHILNNTNYSQMEQIADHRNNFLYPNYAAYNLTAKTFNNDTGFSQYPYTSLSNYQPIKSVTLNLGYSTQARNKVDLNFTAVKGLKFKSAKLVAMPFNKQYDTQMQNLKKTGLTNLKVDQNTVTGTANNQNSSIMVSSIPYSTGWQLTIDGKKASTFVVNKGFVGARMPAGNHQIKLIYTTPGLQIGKIATIAAWIIFAGLAILRIILRTNKSKKSGSF